MATAAGALVYRTEHGTGLVWLTDREARELIDLGHMDPVVCHDGDCPIGHVGPAYHPAAGVNWPDRFKIGQPGGQTNGLAIDDIPFTRIG